MYHVSDFKKYERCKQMFWLSRHNTPTFIPYTNYNMDMLALCMELLGIEAPFIGETNDDEMRAIKALDHYDWLINARFAYDQLRVKIPIIHQKDGKRIVYFPYRLCYPKDNEAQKLADTLQVLALNHIDIDELYIIHLNADYVRQGKPDVKKMLIITDQFYNGNHRPSKQILDCVNAKRRDVMEMIAKLEACEQERDVAYEHSSVCMKNFRCPFISKCFPEQLSDTSILNLVRSEEKYDMYKADITDIKDTDLNCIEGHRMQYAQIMAAKHGMYHDRPAIRSWLMDHIQYPISYLDFEWETFAFPPYDGMKPYDVLCFQYSLHIEPQINAELIHKSFIETDDCRIAFIESLLHDLPNDGTILVYNMEGAEKLRLMQLAEQFPQYRTRLEAVCNRMIDLSLPFSTGTIYDNRMAGYYSLKKLISVFSTYSYQDLDIHDGMSAVMKYRELMQADEEQAAIIKQELDDYCAMDTYAEYLIYHAIERIAWDSEEVIEKNAG